MGSMRLGLAALLATCVFSSAAGAAPDAAKKASAKKAAVTHAATAGKPKGARKTTAKSAAKKTGKRAAPVTEADTTSALLGAALGPTTLTPASTTVPTGTTMTTAANLGPSTPSSAASASPPKTPAEPPPAAALLPVTCNDSSKDPRCARPTSNTGASLGAGPAIHGSSGFPAIGEGFIDGRRLVVAVEMGSQYDDLGAVFGIDLVTGDRTVLSGKIEDPAKGPVVVGSGPDLGNVRAVTQAGSSWMALVSKGSTQALSIIRIDPKTGARTLVRSLDGGVIPCSGSTAKLTIELTNGIAGAPDGTVYAAVGNISNAVGIVAISGSTCNVVTMSGAGGFESKGSGPTLNSLDRYKSLKLDGGKLWALHGMSNSLMTIDIATGNRTRVSSGESQTRVGGGDAKVGYKMLAVNGSKVWTSGGWAGSSGFTLTEVLASNGQRTAREGKSGPASYNDELTGVWVHPTKPLLVIATDNAFSLYDPATGNSAIISE